MDRQKDSWRQTDKHPVYQILNKVIILFGVRVYASDLK